MQQHALWIQNFVIRKLGKKILLLRLHEVRNSVLQLTIAYSYQLYTNTKTELEVAKSSRNCNAPNLCNLQFYYVDMQTEFYSPAIFCITPSM